jgi:uncharacterized protein YjiS (DUF1127 family)
VIDWALTHQAVGSPRDMPRVLSRSFLGAITYSSTNALKAFVILFIHFGEFLELQMLHSGNSDFTTSKAKKVTYLRVVEAKEKRMLRQLFKSMVVARQAAAAIETLKHMSDRQLEDIGFTRATYVDQIKTSVLAELDAADEQKVVVAPVNPNLVGAV